MADLTIENLTKKFDRGKVTAVDELSLQVEDGEFITVVGPSGCGKSTTLRMIAGLERPTSGTIRLGGEDITRMNPRKRDIAMVFQEYALYPHKTVEENMEFGLRMSTDLSKEERHEKVTWAANMMGIEDLLDDKPDELSGGQKQRVALGRSIVREPEVFLFDEPLSNLDAKLRTVMRTEIQRLQNELDITSIYVTHDQEEAMTMGDRMVILKDGLLQQVGRPTDVYANPANRFVGGFIGSPSMNFIDVSVSRSEDTIHMTGIDSSLDYSLKSENISIDDDGVAVLGIRPEHIQVTTENGPQTMSAPVEVVEPVGSDNYLYLDIGEDKNLIARVDANQTPDPGEVIIIRFEESQLHLFDRETGETKLVTDTPTATVTSSSQNA